MVLFFVIVMLMVKLFGPSRPLFVPFACAPDLRSFARAPDLRSVGGVGSGSFLFSSYSATSNFGF